MIKIYARDHALRCAMLDEFILFRAALYESDAHSTTQKSSTRTEHITTQHSKSYHATSLHFTSQRSAAVYSASASMRVNHSAHDRINKMRTEQQRWHQQDAH